MKFRTFQPAKFDKSAYPQPMKIVLIAITVRKRISLPLFDKHAKTKTIKEISENLQDPLAF